MNPPLENTPQRTGAWLLAIIVGGLAAGVGDFVFAMVHYGAPADRIALSVAAGLVGREAANAGGTTTVILGAGLHLFIATTAAAVFALAGRWWRAWHRWPILVGPAYGIAVYFVMNWIVVPLSAIGRPGYPPPVDGKAVGAHMVVVGLPIALACRWLGPRTR